MNKKIKIFSDGADLESFRKLAEKTYIEGFTTNPTLMRKAGVKDYVGFAKEVLEIVGDKPISFEVFTDDQEEMARQANIIKEWGKQVYVKIPIVNSKGSSMLPLIQRLQNKNIKLNITAILAINQLEDLASTLASNVSSVISIFAGRIADTGRDPVPTIETARRLFSSNPSAEILWASTREVLNIRQAEKAGAHIITVTLEILKKYEKLFDKNLVDLSRETSAMFNQDAEISGYKI